MDVLYGVGYLTSTKEKWEIEELKCYGFEFERFWLKFEAHSHLLPYIDWTYFYLVWGLSYKVWSTSRFSQKECIEL